jgi:hypothetical protein
MTIRAPGIPILTNWRRTTSSVRNDQEFIDLVMHFWDKGKNTTDIAEFTFETEATVATALRIGRERRRERQCNEAYQPQG